jgi:O-antigen ligase
MAETKRSGERRRIKAFASPLGRRGRGRIGWNDRIVLGVFPALLFAAHLFFGANHVVAAQWLTLILALGLIVALARRDNRRDIASVAPLWPLAGLFGLTLVVAAWTLTPWPQNYAAPIWAEVGLPAAITVNRSATLLEISKLLGLACAFAVGCVQGARAGRGRATFDAILALGSAYAVIALLSFLSGAQVMDTGRLSGGFLSANSGATVFGLLTVLALANLIRRWRKATHSSVVIKLGALAVPLAYVLLFVTCLLLTASRMGVAATAIAAGALLLWDMIENQGRRLSILIGGGVIALVGVVLLLRGNDLLWARFDALDRDILVRGTIFKAHWAAFLDAPLFGYGLGTFNDVNSLIMTPETYKDLWLIRAAHNVYIQWLEEAGVLGAAPMFLLIATIIALSAWRVAQGHVSQTVQRGLVASSLVILIHGTTDYALQTPSIAAFWAFLLGLQFAFGQSRIKSGGRSAA